MKGEIFVYDRRIRGGEPWGIRSKVGTWKEILLWAKKKKHRVFDQIELTIESSESSTVLTCVLVDIKNMEVKKESPTFFPMFFVFDKKTKTIVGGRAINFKTALKILEVLEAQEGDIFDIIHSYA